VTVVTGDRPECPEVICKHTFPTLSLQTSPLKRGDPLPLLSNFKFGADTLIADGTSTLRLFRTKETPPRVVRDSASEVLPILLAITLCLSRLPRLWPLFRNDRYAYINCAHSFTHHRSFLGEGQRLALV
jgi:hypothetical protein